MSHMHRILGASLLAVLLGVPGSAQFPRTPYFRGVWNPVVGSGGAYEIEGKGDTKQEMELAIVGSEEVDGKTGYWMEMAVRGGGEEQGVVKYLVVLADKETQIKKMVVQAGSQPAMEMPIEMMMRGGKASEQPADIREQAERVATESITTPAGTFTCEHWRMKDNSGDAWISEKVPPYGLVKMTSRDGSMTLMRVLTDAKTRIQGTPQKFNPMEMMRQKPD